MNSKSVISPLSALSSAHGRIPKDLRLAFLSGAIIDLLANMFMYTNSLFLHDNTSPYNYLDGLPSGRFMLNLFFDVFGRIQTPWLTGLLSAALLGLVTVFLNRLLDVKNPLTTILLSSAIVSSPAIVATNFYLSILPLYLFALLMAVITVYFAQKGWPYFFLSVFCLILSLGSYQAYISFSLVLILLMVIKNITNSKDNIKSNLLSCLRYASVIVVGLLLYYFIWQLLLKMTDTPAQSYRGENQVISLFTHGLAGNIIKAWAMSFYYIFTNFLKEETFVYITRLIIAVISLFILFSTIQEKNKALSIGNIVLSCICVFFLPLAISFIYVLNPITPHVLMLFTLITPQLILISSIEKLPNSTAFNAVKWIGILLVFVLSLSNIVYANESYTVFKSDYDNALSYSTRLVDRIEQTDGYSIDTKVVAFRQDENHIEISPYEDKRTWINNLPELAFLHSKSAITYGDTLAWFINDDLNVGMDFSYDNDKMYSVLDQVQELSAFPAKNCTVWIDGVLVVKI